MRKYCELKTSFESIKAYYLYLYTAGMNTSTALLSPSADHILLPGAWECL